MNQKHIGIDLKPLGFNHQLAVMLEGESLEGVGELHCAVREDGRVWEGYPFTVTDDTGVLFEKDMVEDYARADGKVVEILHCQGLVESAGYQWREHSKPMSEDPECGREYIVAITRSFSQFWTEKSPNVMSCGYREDRASCWRELARYAAEHPAMGSKLERESRDTAEAVTVG